MTRRRALTLLAVIVACTGLYAGPASALNKPGAGGSIRRCVHWVNTTNSLGWPIEYCVKYR